MGRRMWSGCCWSWAPTLGSDDGGETALDVARRRGRDGVVEVLESWGGGQDGE